MLCVYAYTNYYSSLHKSPVNSSDAPLPDARLFFLFFHFFSFFFNFCDIHTQGKILQIRHTLVPAVSMLKIKT